MVVLVVVVVVAVAVIVVAAPAYACGNGVPSQIESAHAGTPSRLSPTVAKEIVHLDTERSKYKTIY